MNTRLLTSLEHVKCVNPNRILTNKRFQSGCPPGYGWDLQVEGASLAEKGDSLRVPLASNQGHSCPLLLLCLSKNTG